MTDFESEKLVKKSKNPLVAEVKVEPTQDSGGKITMTPAELKELVNSAVSTALTQSTESSTNTAKMIAEALLEARKPYKSPQQEENDNKFRDSSRELQERIREGLKHDQKSCPHMQGCNLLSEVMGDRSSIAMHQIDTGLVIGICTNCQKVFRSDNVEDAPFFRKPSGNRMSRAGQRFFLDQAKAQRDGILNT